MPPLPELVQALLEPRAYPETPKQIELVQTQMSFVFLTDDYVYKVKKPVNLGYLDYTTLARRHFFCQREVELNRRLSPDVYIGVVPISREGIKKSYGVVSRFYGIIEGIIEKGLRQKALQLLSVTPGEVVLEVGVGAGYSLEEMANSVGENGKACGIDLTPRMLEITRKRLKKAGLTDRVELCEGDARSMPYQDSQFHAVYMASTLELFDTPDIPRVLKEVKRVPKPSGRLGVASMTKEGREGSLFIRFYEWLHQTIPEYANCRPIYVEESVAEAGYQITKAEEFILFKIVPWKIVVARPLAD